MIVSDDICVKESIFSEKTHQNASGIFHYIL